MARSRTPLTVSSGGAASSLRAWAAPSAGVEASLPLAAGRLTKDGLHKGPLFLRFQTRKCALESQRKRGQTAALKGPIIFTSQGFCGSRSISLSTTTSGGSSFDGSSST